ncbi:MAG: dihydrodipicolinate synthase family protein [Planctomycetes bacterium]|nr:dihydrodipicolinate synthase family protein [Planctomycetota bacterium]
MSEQTHRPRVLAALVSPRRAGHLDESALGLLVDRLAGAGLDGFLVGGSTGRGDRLSAEELDRSVDLVRRRHAGLEIVAGFGASPLDPDLLRRRLDGLVGRVDRVLIPPPEDDGAVPEYFAALVRDSAIPVLVYQPPARRSRPFPTALARELAELPGLDGVKDSSGAEELIAAWRSGRPGFRLLLGSISLFARRAAEVDGAILAFANLHPTHCLALARGAARSDPAVEADLRRLGEGGLEALEAMLGISGRP